MLRFSSSVARMTSVAWKADDLPTRVITAARESIKARMPASAWTLISFRLVMPNAQTFRCLRSSSRNPLEILGVFFVGGRVPALDEIEAEVVEAFGQFQLVEEREADALGLGAVAERGVVDFDASHVNTSTAKRTENSGQGCRTGISFPCSLSPVSNPLNKKTPRPPLASGLGLSVVCRKALWPRYPIIMTTTTPTKTCILPNIGFATKEYMFGNVIYSCYTPPVGWGRSNHYAKN